MEKPAQNDSEEEPKAKRPKWEKKKTRGQNKSRPQFKEDLSAKLCRSLIDGTASPCRLEKCTFVHDVRKFWSLKSPDLGPTCFVFEKIGYCHNGLTCRYASGHVDTENLTNRGVDKRDTIRQTTFNQIEYDLMNLLRKKTYDFGKSDGIISKIKPPPPKENAAEKEEIAADPKLATDKPLGFSSDEDIVKPRNGEKPKVDFRNKILMSPLTTVGNLPFRRVCKEYGVDITCGEMACSIPLINGAVQEWALTKRHESEDIFGVQICGHKANLCSYAAQLIDEHFNVDFVDLNIGCPIDLIYKQGAGSALIRRTNVLEEIVRSCSTLLGDKPFTVKTRTGVYADKSVAHELLPKFESWGAAAVTVSWYFSLLK